MYATSSKKENREVKKSARNERWKPTVWRTKKKTLWVPDVANKMTLTEKLRIYD